MEGIEVFQVVFAEWKSGTGLISLLMGRPGADSKSLSLNSGEYCSELAGAARNCLPYALFNCPHKFNATDEE